MRLLPRCIHHLNRIQLTIWTICAFKVLNPHQLSLAKQSSLKSWKVIHVPQNAKQAEAKRDGVIKPQNYKFNQFQKRKILMLSKRYKSTAVDRRTWLHVALGDSLFHQQWHSWNMNTDFYQDVYTICNRIQLTIMNHISIQMGLMLKFCWKQNLMHISYQQKYLAFFFSIFQKVVFYDPLPINDIINRSKLCFILQRLLHYWINLY